MLNDESIKSAHLTRHDCRLTCSHIGLRSSTGNTFTMYQIVRQINPYVPDTVICLCRISRFCHCHSMILVHVFMQLLKQATPKKIIELSGIWSWYKTQQKSLFPSDLSNFTLEMNFHAKLTKWVGQSDGVKEIMQKKNELVMLLKFFLLKKKSIFYLKICFFFSIIEIVYCGREPRPNPPR